MASCSNREENQGSSSSGDAELKNSEKPVPLPTVQVMDEVPLTQLVEMEMDQIHREDRIRAKSAGPGRRSILNESLSERDLKELVSCSDNSGMRRSARDRTRMKCLVRRKSISIIHSPYPSPERSPLPSPSTSPIPEIGAAPKEEEEDMEQEEN